MRGCSIICPSPPIGCGSGSVGGIAKAGGCSDNSILLGGFVGVSSLNINSPKSPARGLVVSSKMTSTNPLSPNIDTTIKVATEGAELKS